MVVDRRTGSKRINEARCNDQRVGVDGSLPGLVGERRRVVDLEEVLVDTELDELRVDAGLGLRDELNVVRLGLLGVRDDLDLEVRHAAALVGLVRLVLDQVVLVVLGARRLKVSQADLLLRCQAIKVGRVLEAEVRAVNVEDPREEDRVRASLGRRREVRHLVLEHLSL